MAPSANTLQLKISGICLIIAPILFGASTFFWQKGEYGVSGTTLLVLSTVFWVPALIALFDLLKTAMPLYASIGFVVAVYGVCVGGVGFGLLGYFSTIFNITHQAYIKTLAQYPISSGLLFFWAGPLFPLSLLVLGINLVRKKVIKQWLGILLCLGAVAFPMSRIPRIEFVAHLADLLLAIPIVTIGLRYIFRTEQEGLSI